MRSADHGEHQIPVTPINYALWYCTYVSNEDPTLNQRIDEIVSAYGMIPLTKAEDLFREHVSSTGDIETALHRMKDSFEQMVSGIDHDLNATLAGTRSFSTLLDECNRDLRGNTTAGAGSVDDIFGTLDKLLQGSTAMQQNTSRFEQRLSAANEEIRRLRSEPRNPAPERDERRASPASSTAAPSTWNLRSSSSKATGAR